MITQKQSKFEKLVEFAEKGGIGTCVANQDISARSEADLMFYTGEVITVLKHIKDDTYLGYCEGVIGTFKGKTVKFNGPLKTPKTMKSSQDKSDKGSPKQLNLPNSPKLLNPLNPAKELSMSLSNDENLESSENNFPTSPIINIIPDISDNVFNAPLFNQNNAKIVHAPRTSSLLYEHTTPILPRKQNTMPQLSVNPEHNTPQRRNNTVPIISISHDQSNYSSSSPPPPPSPLLSSPLSRIIGSNNEIMNSHQQPSPVSPINTQNQTDQTIMRSRQNSVPTIPGFSHINTSQSQRNEHHRSISSPNINRFYDSPSGSPVSPQQKPNYNKTPGSLPNSPNSPISNSFQYKSYNQAPNTMINNKSSPTGFRSLPNSPPGINQNYQGYPGRFSEQIHGIGHYSPSTTPLPSPKLPQIKVFHEEPATNDHYSPSTTPLPSPRFAPRSIPNNNTNTPAPTPSIIPPKIVLEEDSELDDDSDDQEETLISYASSRSNSPNLSNSSKPTEVSKKDPETLKVGDTSYSRSNTPSEQLSANESEDISSEDEDEKDEVDENESKIEVKSESGSSEVQSPKSPKKKKEQILAIDEYGFVYDVSEKDIPPGADRIQRIIQAPGAEEKTTRTVRLYREREAKWVALLGSMDPIVARDSKKIKKLVRSGIPESVRGKAWQFMACSDKYRKPGFFDESRNKPRLPIYDVIEKDIHRCYPDHIQFREESGFGQDDLHDILKAYAHYNPAVGYCQGMGRLVGMMLMQMPAEDTFWLLVATIREYMVGYFTPTLSQIRIDSLVFEQLLAEHDPRLAQHLANNGVVPIMYMTQWFMTIFTMALPWASVLRVWDIFYFEGVKLFFRIGLAIMDCTKEHILKNCPSSSEILGFLLHIPPELLTPDLLLEAAFKIRLKRSVIRRMTKRAIAMEKSNEKNNEGSDTGSAITAGSNEETRRGLMKKSKSFDKLRIDGIEFKLVGE